MTVARWALVVVVGAGLATACLLPGIDPQGSSADGCDPPCDDPSECGQRLCTDGECAFVAAGTPTEAQVMGDCRVDVCDGQGSTTTAVDDSDAPEDEICAVASCEAGEPVFVDAPDGTTCGEDLACLGGVCAGCSAPSDCGPASECTYFECVNPGPSGECTLLSSEAGVLCGPSPTCVNEAQLSANVCDGRGGCVAQSQTCDPYACVASSCAVSCTASTGCAPGAGCSGGACDDCRTCNEWLSVTDVLPSCATATTLMDALYDCTCHASGPCLVDCNATLCAGQSPLLLDDCAACLERSCKPELDACAADVDPVP